MRCRICGAKLRKEGDICKSCYEEYCKEEALEKDTKEIFKVRRKYLPKYQLTRYGDWYVVFVIIFAALLAQKQLLPALVTVLVGIVFLGVAMFISKRVSKNTSCTFYEKKIVYTYKDRKKTIAYSDLKNVTYYQNFFQKIFNLADLQFHPTTGSYILGGFEIRNVPDLETNLKRIQEIIETKKEV